MVDGNVGIYNGATYVAKEKTSVTCTGCGGKREDGTINTAFCNAMPNCFYTDRRDRRSVIFVKQEIVDVAAELAKAPDGSAYKKCCVWRLHAGCGESCFALCNQAQRLACSVQFDKDTNTKESI